MGAGYEIAIDRNLEVELVEEPAVERPPAWSGTGCPVDAPPQSSVESSWPPGRDLRIADPVRNWNSCSSTPLRQHASGHRHVHAEDASTGMPSAHPRGPILRKGRRLDFVVPPVRRVS